ncbi:MAG: hypothetical protein GXX91_01785 [Verrucomicrobiaceae bacterium]|nr:hypothetical protein [Verrucomicrobiaceae bacterium]
MNVPTRETDPSPHGTAKLSDVEIGFVRFFVHLAMQLNLARSVGEIFGYLFASPEPRTFDQVVDALEISKGSASQGLKFLGKISAVSIVYVPGDRRSYYQAEGSMRKVFGDAFRETVRPQLESNRHYLHEIEQLTEAAGDMTPEMGEHYRTRLSSLRGWNDKALMLLPLLDKLFSLPAPLFPFNLFGAKPPEPVDGESPEASS